MTLRVMSIFRVLVLVRYSSCVHKIEREVSYIADVLTRQRAIIIRQMYIYIY